MRTLALRGGQPHIHHVKGRDTGTKSNAIGHLVDASVHNRRMNQVVVGIGPVTIDDVVRVARDNAAVVIADDALAAIASSRSHIEALAEHPTPVYGVSTGFGALATRHIPVELRTKLQRSLIRSHAAGSGPEVEREVIRAMMLLRLSTLATGRTGVRPDVAQRIRGDALGGPDAGGPRVRQPRLLR